MEFNLSRFIILLKAEVHIKRKFFLLSILSILAVTVITAMLLISQNIVSGSEPQLPHLIVYVILLGLGGLLASFYLNDFQTKARRIQYLILPASQFEKVALKWFLTLPIFLLVALAFQFVVRLVAPMASPALIEMIAAKSDIYRNMTMYFSLLFVFGHAILLFFSILFNRYAVFWAGLIMIGIYFLNGIVGGIYRYGSGLSDFGFTNAVSDQLWISLIYFSESLWLMAIISVLLWIGTYFMIKRKQA